MDILKALHKFYSLKTMFIEEHYITINRSRALLTNSTLLITDGMST